jgi:group I intron endonuclease
MKQRTEDKGKSGIYLIRNLINGKVYVGKARCIYKRIKQHVTSLNTKNGHSENDHLINSWHKHGRNSFDYVVLEYLPLDENLIKEKEIYYIQKYECLNPTKGYNKISDSSTGLIVSEETRKKLSEAQINRFKNPDERKKLGDISRKFWADNPDKLKSMSEKVASKIRKYKIGKFRFNSNVPIEIFETRKELQEKYPNYYVQAILGCCQGSKYGYKGFSWKYISIETGEIIIK